MRVSQKRVDSVALHKAMTAVTNKSIYAINTFMIMQVDHIV